MALRLPHGILRLDLRDIDRERRLEASKLKRAELGPGFVVGVLMSCQAAIHCRITCVGFVQDR